jgi:hypothetical protein
VSNLDRTATSKQSRAPGRLKKTFSRLSLARVYKSASTVLHQESALRHGGDYLSRSLANPADDEIAALADAAGAATSLAG